MNANFQFVTLVERMGWVLVHSVWQFAVVAVVAALAAGLMRRASAAARYRLLLVALAAIVAAPLATWFILGEKTPAAIVHVPVQDGESVVANAGPIDVSLERSTATADLVSAPPAAPESLPVSWRDEVEHLCRPWLGTIVAVWCFGVGFFALRPLLGLRTLRRLRSVGVSPLPESLQEKFAELSKRLLRGRAAPILLSAIAKTPMIVGGWRPMILLPLGILSELPLAQIEAILAHELAHIRRHDFLVNLLQTLIETLFFYHPAVWWISRRLRQEREYCCDDAAVIAIGDRAAYGRALLALEERRAEPALLAVGAKSGSLAARIERLCERPVSRRSLPVGIAFTAMGAALLIGAITTAAVWGVSPDPKEADVVANESKPIAQAITVLAGIIIDVAEKPVADIEVLACNRAGDIKARTRSDASGAFSFGVPKRTTDPYGAGFSFLIAIDGDSRVGWHSLEWKRVMNLADGAEGSPQAVKLTLFERNATLRGRVVGPGAEPLAGATVAVDFKQRLVADSFLSLGDSPFPRATTDAEGRYELRVPEESIARLTIHHPDWVRADLYIDRKKFPAAAGTTTELPKIEVERGGRIEGRITEAATGKGLEGMTVSARGIVSSGKYGAYGYGETDADGRYSISGLHPEYYSVQASHLQGGSPLVSPVMEGLEVIAGMSVRRDFAMVEGKLVRGRVTEAESGEAIPHAEVVARVSTTPNEKSIVVGRLVYTDEEGRYEVYVPPGICWIQSQKANYDPHMESERTLDVARLEAPIDVDLQLKKTARHEDFGRVFDERWDPSAPRPKQPTLLVKLRTDPAKPIGDYVVRRVYLGSNRVSQESYPSGPQYETTFGADDVGKRVQLLFDVPGFAPATTEFAIAFDAPSIVIDLKPAEYAPIRGVVVDRDGKPISDARIRVRRIIHGESNEFPWGVETTTDKDGRFELTHLRVGERVAVHASKDGIGEIETDPFLIEKKDVIELPKMTLGAADATVAGVITDQRGAPLPLIAVSLDGVPSRRTTTDAAGRFRLTDLPRGWLTLRLQSPDQGAQSVFVRSPTEDARLFAFDHVYKPTEFRRLHLRVIANDEQPLTNACYYLFDLTDHRLTLLNGSVNDDGKVDIGHLIDIRKQSNHKFGVVAIADGCAVSPIVELMLTPTPQSAEVVLTRAPMAKVSGRVVDENGEPLAGVSVGFSRQLTDSLFYEPWRYRRVNPRDDLVTDAEGRFELALHRGSPGSIYVNKAGGAGATSEPFLVRADGDVSLRDIRLAPADRTIRGRITTVNGEPIPHARAHLLGFSLLTAETDSNGDFEFVSAPNGKLGIMTWKNGFHDQSTIVPPDSNQIDIRLRVDERRYGPDPYHLAE